MNKIEIDEYSNKIWYFHSDYAFYYLKIYNEILGVCIKYFRCSSATPSHRFKMFRINGETTYEFMFFK